MKLQKLLSYVRRAVDDYSMIEEGDKIAVGISGGKDSICLLVALKHLQRFYPKRFELEAITVSLGLPGASYDGIQALCNELGVHYTVVETDIGKIIFDERKEKRQRRIIRCGIFDGDSCNRTRISDPDGNFY